jgi:nucleotide-binding universal stress UspA family protein
VYKHILIATDGSELAEKGLGHGLALAKALDAAVTVVTVTDFWSPLAMADEAMRGRPNPPDEYEKVMARAAGRILDSAEAKARAAGVKAQAVHVADKHPAQGIVEAAAQNGCDLIVMSSHGRRGARALMLGSQTAEVVAHTTVPVLVIR